MLENFADKYSGQITITKDTADFFCAQPQSLFSRPFRHSDPLPSGEESSITPPSGGSARRSFAHAQDDTGKTLLVISMGQLQKLGVSLKLPYAFTSDLGMLQLVELLHELTTAYPQLHILTRHQNQYVVAVKGNIGTSPAPGEKPVWRVATAAAAATWWLQTPAKPFEALLTSLAK
jgi:hypothetical protein